MECPAIASSAHSINGHSELVGSSSGSLASIRRACSRRWQKMTRISWRGIWSSSASRHGLEIRRSRQPRSTQPGAATRWTRPMTKSTRPISSTCTTQFGVSRAVSACQRSVRPHAQRSYGPPSRRQDPSQASSSQIAAGVPAGRRGRRNAHRQTTGANSRRDVPPRTDLRVPGFSPDGLEGMARLGGDEYVGARITSVGFLRRMQRRIPDFGARSVVFIPSHLFHPLHLCEKLAACERGRAL